MYKEKSFKRTITILRVRRYLFIYLFVIIGLVASWFAVRTLIELLDFPKTIIPVVMIAVGVTIFLIAFILSSNVEFKIKQAKLEMEIYNKLRLNTAMLTKLLAINGIDTSVDLIRYFELNGKQFLIYTLGELDNQAYQISYITKIEDHKGQLLSGEEWTLMTAIIKKIAGEGATISELVDLPASSLQGLDVYYTKPFKLPMASTNLLCAKEVKEIAVEQKEVTEQVPSSETVKKQESENDADPVLTEKYTFHVQDEPVIPDEKVEIPALEPSKMISFEEFKEDMNDFEDKLDIDQFEEMKLEELPETEPLMTEEDHKEDEKNMNQKN